MTGPWSAMAPAPINTLRVWAAKAPHNFDFAQFNSGDFIGALVETLTAEIFARVLYPDDHKTESKGSAAAEHLWQPNATCFIETSHD